MTDDDELRQLESLRVDWEKRPDFFYKYRSLAIDGTEDRRSSHDRTKDIILDSELYYAPPVKFNDPFEMRFSVDVGTTQERIDFYADLLLRSQDALTQSEARAKATQHSEAHPDGYFDDFAEGLNEKLRNTTGVLCLSRPIDEILLWSHYADEHRGIALQFNSWRSIFLGAIEVDYEKKYPGFRPNEPNMFVKARVAVLTKYEGWQYEGEWRLWDSIEGPGVRKFHPDALVGVVFGLETSDDDKVEVRRWLTGRSIRFFQCYRDKMSYSIRVEVLAG